MENGWIYVAVPVISVGIIIATRPIVLWYYRVNNIMKLMEEQDKSLKQIAFMLSGKIRVKIEDEKEPTSS